MAAFLLPGEDFQPLGLLAVHFPHGSPSLVPPPVFPEVFKFIVEDEEIAFMVERPAVDGLPEVIRIIDDDDVVVVEEGNFQPIPAHPIDMGNIPVFFYRVPSDDEDEEEEDTEDSADWSIDSGYDSMDSEVGDEEVGNGDLEAAMAGLWPPLEPGDPQVADRGALWANVALRGSDRGGPEESAASASGLGSSRKRPGEEAEGPSVSKKSRQEGPAGPSGSPAGGVGAEDSYEEPTPSTSGLCQSRERLWEPFNWRMYEDSDSD